MILDKVTTLMILDKVTTLMILDKCEKNLYCCTSVDKATTLNMRKTSIICRLQHLT